MNENIGILELEQSNNLALYKTKKFIYLSIKRFFDIFCALIGCIFLIPIILIVKLLTMCTGDFKPIFFSQKRIGKNGKEFNLYKFRSMMPDADELLFRMLKEDKKLAKEYEQNKKLDNDPRITKLGRILRKTSIDELPQFINVLNGNMTLIGNRPYLPRERKDMKKYYDDIIKTKPGLTGYWQVNLRSSGSFEDRLKMEKYYSNHAGFKMDIKIFFKTFKVVLCGKDAK